MAERSQGWKDLEALAVRLPCARCGARRDDRCRKPDGSEREAHQARRGPIDTAYLLGRETQRMEARGW